MDKKVEISFSESKLKKVLVVTTIVFIFVLILVIIALVYYPNKVQEFVPTEISQLIPSAEVVPPNLTVAMNLNTPDMCQDSDGGQEFDVEGVVVNSSGSIFMDNCISQKILREYYCQNGIVKLVDFSCANSCISGHCVEYDQNCFDSDGGMNVNERGISFGLQGDLGRITFVQDSCIAGLSNLTNVDNSNFINEYFCSGNEVTSSIHNCPSGCSNGECTNTSLVPIALNCTVCLEEGKNYSCLSGNSAVCSDISTTGECLSCNRGGCGNGVCEFGESHSNCNLDCGISSCGDGVCDYPFENDGSCPTDCRYSCGNGKCDGIETYNSCPEDCGCSRSSCGNGVCEPPSEGYINCPEDCGNMQNCGDRICSSGESIYTCPSDCRGNFCGDGVCEFGESHSNCNLDCKLSTCGNGVCDCGPESVHNCPEDCLTICGNGVCEFGESAQNCPADCLPRVCDICPSNGTLECDENGERRVCQIVDGCLTWSGNSCGNGEICDNSTKECVENNNLVCNLGDSVCNGNGYMKCIDSTLGRTWSNTVECGSKQICVDGNCVDDIVAENNYCNDVPDEGDCDSQVDTGEQVNCHMEWDQNACGACDWWGCPRRCGAYMPVCDTLIETIPGKCQKDCEALPGFADRINIDYNYHSYMGAADQAYSSSCGAMEPWGKIRNVVSDPVAAIVVRCFEINSDGSVGKLLGSTRDPDGGTNTPIRGYIGSKYVFDTLNPDSGKVRCSIYNGLDLQLGHPNPRCEVWATDGVTCADESAFLKSKGGKGTLETMTWEDNQFTFCADDYSDSAGTYYRSQLANKIVLGRLRLSSTSSGEGGTTTASPESSAYYACEDNPSLDLQGDFSISGWVKYNVLRGPYWSNAIASKRQDESNKWLFGYNADSYSDWSGANTGNANTIEFGVANSDIENPWVHIPSDSLPITIGINEWHQMGITRSGDTFTFYLDGSPVGTRTASIEMPKQTAYLTVGYAEGAVEGTTNHVTIYNRALSPTEMNELYTNPLDSGLTDYSQIISVNQDSLPSECKSMFSWG